jgi:hypothetical protein
VHFARKKGDPLDCSICVPQLYPENEDAARIFKLVYDQVRISPTGKIIGLDMSIVLSVIEKFGVENIEDCIGKLRLLTKYFIKDK